MVAAMTPLPVIGVPCTPAGGHLDGIDALLSIAQMPRGVPVATVAIGNATNAGLLAVRMLGVQHPDLMRLMCNFQASQRMLVERRAARLEEVGWEAYLDHGSNKEVQKKESGKKGVA
jgi:phosphoribosylaminoimidazole carboxylase